MESANAFDDASNALVPALTRTWSCNTLLRASSFLADQQAQHKGQMTGKDAIAATRNHTRVSFLKCATRTIPFPCSL